MPPNPPRNWSLSLMSGRPGAYAGFLKGGGATLKFVGFWIYMPRSGLSRAAKLRAFARGVWGVCSPKKIFKNGAILCVLRAIFNHFHGKKSSQKIINKHEFFHWPFYNAATPLIYLNIDVMDI